jgi:hypothetical protein
MEMARVKVVLFSVAVALVSVFFCAYAIQAVYPGPSYDDFCDDYSAGVLMSEGGCIEKDGKWIDHESDSLDMKIDGYCDYDYYCWQDYEEALMPYERNVFFANLVIGFLLLVGAFFLTVDSVSAGLMGGAIMLIFYGTMRYWGELSDIWRTIVLGIALAVLVWLGYKKIKE